MNYQRSCEDFALFGSPWEEHCNDQASEFDYNQEAFAGERDQFAWCEDFDEEDIAFCDAHGVTDEASYYKALEAERKTLNIRDLI